MDDFLKYIAKLPSRERDFWLTVIQVLYRNNREEITLLDIKKLSGFKSLYRVRKWDKRLIYKVIEWKNTVILVGARGDVYAFLRGYKE